MKRYANYHAFPRKAMAMVATTAMLVAAAPAFADDNWLNMPLVKQGDHWVPAPNASIPETTGNGFTFHSGSLKPATQAPFSSAQEEALWKIGGLTILAAGLCATIGCFDSPEQAEARQRADEERDARMTEELFRWSVEQ